MAIHGIIKRIKIEISIVLNFYIKIPIQSHTASQKHNQHTQRAQRASQPPSHFKYEPVREKTNNLHGRKQRRRSASR